MPAPRFSPPFIYCTFCLLYMKSAREGVVEWVRALAWLIDSCSLTPWGRRILHKIAPGAQLWGRLLEETVRANVPYVQKASSRGAVWG